MSAATVLVCIDGSRLSYLALEVAATVRRHGSFEAAQSLHKHERILLDARSEGLKGHSRRPPAIDPYMFAT